MKHQPTILSWVSHRSLLVVQRDGFVCNASLSDTWNVARSPLQALAKIILRGVT